MPERRTRINISYMKRSLFVFLVSLIFIISGCGRNYPDASGDTGSAPSNIVVGFSQLGAESDWRAANTESMKQVFTKANGYELVFEDGQQKQSNQITAIRSFIQQGVDYIVLAPVTETGWDTVLAEAKDAGIPVIIVDRMVDVDDESLFTCWVGSDFELEGLMACEWLKKYTECQEIDAGDINVVNIQGNIGSSAQIGRTRGLRTASKRYGWNLLEEVCGDFTQAKAREVMTDFLRKYDNVNVVYCENDNEALGAIEAIESAGLKVGSNIKEGEIMILSFDGVNEQAMQYLREGKIACITECNPHHGPRVESIISSLERGNMPEKLEYVDEKIYSAFDKVEFLFVKDRQHKITILGLDNEENY